MEGSHGELVHYSSEMVPPPWKRFFSILLKFILQSQYVGVEFLPQLVWRVICGAGMGVGCSGEVCDAVFYNMVEKDFVDCPTICRQFRVYHYARFKDDIFLCIGGSPTSRYDFLSQLKTRSKIWRLKVESVSSLECSFLDLHIGKIGLWRSCGMLDISICHKPSSQYQPLAPHSMHPPSVHISWPAGMIRRAEALCNSKAAVKQEVLYLWRLISARSGSTFAGIALGAQNPRPPVRCQTDNQVSRILLPYFAGWDTVGLNGSLRKLCETYRQSFMRDLGSALDVRVAYTLAGPHLRIHLFQLAIRGVLALNDT